MKECVAKKRGGRRFTSSSWSRDGLVLRVGVCNVSVPPNPCLLPPGPSQARPACRRRKDLRDERELTLLWCHFASLPPCFEVGQPAQKKVCQEQVRMPRARRRVNGPLLFLQVDEVEPREFLVPRLPARVPVAVPPDECRSVQSLFEDLGPVARRRVCGGSLVGAKDGVAEVDELLLPRCGRDLGWIVWDGSDGWRYAASCRRCGGGRSCRCGCREGSGRGE